MMRSLLRTLFIIPQAALVTLLLLTLMVSLVEFSDKNIHTKKRIKLPNIYTPEIEIETQRKIEKPDKPQLNETPPPDIPQQDFAKIKANAEIAMIAAGKLNLSLDLNIGAGLQATDQEYLPIVKIAPQYPRRALYKGIQGYVILEYTVTKHGTVQNPVVIEEEPKDVFSAAAIKSALRYKYKPRVVDGVPIAVANVRTKIIFQLEE